MAKEVDPAIRTGLEGFYRRSCTVNPHMDIPKRKSESSAGLPDLVTLMHFHTCLQLALKLKKIKFTLAEVTFSPANIDDKNAQTVIFPIKISNELTIGMCLTLTDGEMPRYLGIGLYAEKTIGEEGENGRYRECATINPNGKVIVERNGYFVDLTDTETLSETIPFVSAIEGMIREHTPKNMNSEA